MVEEKGTNLEPPVNSRLLKEITRRIVAKIDPEKIILFGSHAYGNPNKDSDLDLFIIKNTKLPASKRYAMISDALFPRLVPMDFIVRAPKEIDSRLKGFDPFIKEVLNKGKTLYERK
ncbi:nucleotidyltransferase domain-containing protein [Candidatus Saganbacteria bacterium]|nr:nucleotidyltransferase domain-containing protein [Candidatus Saganbacteria bacterium]